MCRVFIFKAPGSSPLQGQPACAKMAAYPDPPPVIPVPESLAAQGPYVRLSCPGLARARNVSRHWGPPRACYRVPCCDKGDPSSPMEFRAGSRKPPPSRGWNDGDPATFTHPLGQPQLNVPEERRRPWGRPLRPRFPKEPHHRRATDDSLCGSRPQSEIVFVHRGQIRGEGRCQAAT